MRLGSNSGMRQCTCTFATNLSLISLTVVCVWYNSGIGVKFNLQADKMRGNVLHKAYLLQKLKHPLNRKPLKFDHNLWHQYQFLYPLNWTSYGRCVPMGNAVPMGAKLYPMSSFHMLNVLLPYTLSDPLRLAPMGTPPILHFCYDFQNQETTEYNPLSEISSCMIFTGKIFHANITFASQRSAKVE